MPAVNVHIHVNHKIFISIAYNLLENFIRCRHESIFNASPNKELNVEHIELSTISID